MFMFQIILFHINLDIRIDFFGYYFGFSVFSIIRWSSVNNTLGLDMSIRSIRVFLIFWTGLNFLVWVQFEF